MASRHLLVFRNSLYDFPGPQCKSLGDRETLEKGVPQNAHIPSSTKVKNSTRAKWFKRHLER